MSDETVTDWIAALKSGDERAAREMWARYFGRVADLARAKMGAAPRRVADEEDVALSVFDSLCEGAARVRTVRSITVTSGGWPCNSTLAAAYRS
jgi:hypothetical protein